MHLRYLALTWTLALTACGDAEIGNDLCSGDGLSCDSLAPLNDYVDVTPAFAVSPQSLTKVVHSAALPPLGARELEQYELLTDRAGTLWEFGMQATDKLNSGSGEARLRVRTTTLDGEVQQSVVDSPWGSSSDERGYLGKVHNSERGPILLAAWTPAKCADKGGCQQSEALAFGSDLDASPERFDWTKRTGGSWPDFYAEARGRWTALWHISIEQRNRSFELTWRQTAIQVANYIAQNAELLDTGELAFLASGGEFQSIDDSAVQELWRIGADGNVKQRLAMDLWRNAHLVHDSQHRALAAGGDRDGGLVVYRHDGREVVRRWTFLRTEYSALSIWAAGVDRADTLYLLTETGGREAADRVPVVCRVHSNDAADCFLLEKPAEAKELQKMQATGPGIIYVSDGQRTFRFELPTD